MPLFDHRCPACGAMLEEFCHNREPEPLTCACGTPMKKLLSAGMKFKFDPMAFFEPFTTENILPGGEPVTVRSKEHMDSLCREHGLTATPNQAKLQ